MPAAQGLRIVRVLAYFAASTQAVRIMPKFSANLSFLFQELPFMERLEAAARAGFRAVEYMAPYPMMPARSLAVLKSNGPTQALFNPPADWDQR